MIYASPLPLRERARERGKKTDERLLQHQPPRQHGVLQPRPAIAVLGEDRQGHGVVADELLVGVLALAVGVGPVALQLQLQPFVKLRLVVGQDAERGLLILKTSTAIAHQNGA